MTAIDSYLSGAANDYKNRDQLLEELHVAAENQDKIYGKEDTEEKGWRFRSLFIDDYLLSGYTFFATFATDHCERAAKLITKEDFLKSPGRWMNIYEYWQANQELQGSRVLFYYIQDFVLQHDLQDYNVKVLDKEAIKRFQKQYHLTEYAQTCLAILDQVYFEKYFSKQ